MSELKPCPFCGGEASIEYDGLYRWVECLNSKCEASARVFMFINDVGNADYIVAQNWNTRPIEDALNARIAELEGKIDQLTAHYNDAVSAGKVSVDVKRELTDAEIEELGAQEAERKEFCPNCEAVTPCTHEAELFVCDICGEDFAKYIVSRKASVPDVSTTQDVLIDIKTPSSIENNNPDYYKQELARIAEFSQAVGLITTMKPTMVMDANHPLDMVREVGEHVTARIAELEAAQRWIPVSERLPEDGEFVLAWDDEIIEVLEYKNTFGGASFLNIADTTVYPTHWMPLPEPPEVE